MTSEESPSPRLGRRVFLGGGAALLGATGLGWVLGHGDEATSRDIFPADAPKDPLFSRWKRRGWAKEASHYFTLGHNVQCQLCPNQCLLEPEDRGHCRNRVHKEGKLYTLVYGNPAAYHVDPIEKKPLFHFLPNARAFSIGTAGCNFRCKNCQNWEMSQRTPEQLKDASGEEYRVRPENLRERSSDDVARATLFPEDVAAVAMATGSKVVAYTYSEPVTFFEYMLETARQTKKSGLRNVWISNGYIKRDPLLELCAVIDAANINLKSFSRELYADLNGGTLEPVLRTLELLHERGVWLEVTHLVIPTVTDKPEMLRRLAGWIAKHLGEAQPLHLSRFHPKYRLEQLPPTPQETLLKARELAGAEGLKHVYLGNVGDVEGAENTLCPKCRRVVVERKGFSTSQIVLRGGDCPDCGTPVGGVWGA